MSHFLRNSNGKKMAVSGGVLFVNQPLASHVAHLKYIIAI